VGLPWWLIGKELANYCRRPETQVPFLCQEDLLVSGRSPGEGNNNTLQYSCLKNPMDRGNCQTTVHGVTKS